MSSGHEVADAAEAEEGFGTAAHGDANAHHFLQGAGEEGGLGIRAEPKPIAEASAYRIDVL